MHLISLTCTHGRTYSCAFKYTNTLMNTHKYALTCANTLRQTHLHVHACAHIHMRMHALALTRPLPQPPILSRPCNC